MVNRNLQFNDAFHFFQKKNDMIEGNIVRFLFVQGSKATPILYLSCSSLILLSCGSTQIFRLG